VYRTEGASAAFIKELMRRTAQYHLEADGGRPLEAADVEAALDEILFTGGSLNLKLLGGAARSSARPPVRRWAVAGGREAPRSRRDGLGPGWSRPIRRDGLHERRAVCARARLHQRAATVATSFSSSRPLQPAVVARGRTTRRRHGQARASATRSAWSRRRSRKGFRLAT